MAEVIWNGSILDPLGDSTITFTVIEDADWETGLMTFRGGKDTDLTADQFLAIAQASLMAAARILSRNKPAEGEPDAD